MNEVSGGGRNGASCDGAAAGVCSRAPAAAAITEIEASVGGATLAEASAPALNLASSAMRLVSVIAERADARADQVRSIQRAIRLMHA